MNECTHTFTGVGSFLVLREPTPPPIQDTGHFTLDSLVQDILEDKPEVLKEFCQSMDEENLFGNGWKGFVKIQMWNHIHHFDISHNAPYSPPHPFPPPSPPQRKKICITFVCPFSCVLQPCHEKVKTMPMQNFLGGGTNKVHFEKCGSRIFIMLL